MRGLHLTADLRGCAAGAPLMTLPSALRDACLAAVAQAGLTAVGELFHPFAPAADAMGTSPGGGVTGVVLLAESHLAVHTWPETHAATLDVYVCNVGADNSARAELVLAVLVEAFGPEAIERHALQRGVLATFAGVRAIVLAAGRGTRMRPLSDERPKPLVEVHGKPLIVWHLEALARGGVREVVINTAWLEEKIVDSLGDGSRWGVAITYSLEGRDHGGALETAGGIATALPLLGDAFWIVSADIWAPDFVFDADAAARFGASARLAHLWLVPNPLFHPGGDFGLGADGLALAEGTGPDGRRWTYANIALARAELFGATAPGTPAKLAPLLYAGMREGRIGAEVYGGQWENVGTPEQLEALNMRNIG